MPLDSMPSIDELAAQLDKKKVGVTHSDPTDEKPVGQPKVEGDTSHTVVDPQERAQPKTVHQGQFSAEVGGEEEPAAVPASPEPKPVEKRDPQAAKFAALARREKAAREQQAAFEKEKADIEVKRKELDEFQAKLKGAKNPMEVMKAYGWDYNAVTEAQLGVYKEPEKDPLDQKLEERLNPIDERFKKYDEQMNQMQTYIKSLEEERLNYVNHKIDNDITSAAKATGCDYVAEAGEEGVQLVRNLIQEFYNVNKKVLTYEEACEKIEAYYSERIEKFLATPKARSKFAPTASAPSTQSPKPTQSTPATSAPERPSTLTNSLSQGTRATQNVDAMSKDAALDILARKLVYRNT